MNLLSLSMSGFWDTLHNRPATSLSLYRIQQLPSGFTTSYRSLFDIHNGTKRRVTTSLELPVCPAANFIVEVVLIYLELQRFAP